MSDPSARERAYALIQGRILAGEWAGGYIVSEQALSREMGISRTPIREAVRQLAGEGYLEQGPNRVTAVARLSRADIHELFELREAIEVFAVQRTSESGLSGADATRLQRFLQDMERFENELEASGTEYLSDDEMQRFIQADIGFHTLLLHAAGNRRMVKLVMETRLLIRIFSIRRPGHTAVQLRDIHEQHSAILGAVLERRGGDAAGLLGAHIRASGAERMEAYDELERERALEGWPVYAGGRAE